ncbi:beta strand repeat-containing protein [Legionella bozemanae]|uniref:Uncharacterized protein n=1 Tax=Legionella bozemanae TaxID=447 RepID=A0A0W0RJU0_LEGBO|nr:inverse autotransporter beta domain-containing protein [Legionella bozemanae]KTC71332.1 hypothetical protein Lboz_2909 [Legionella bozemanae]STO34649.1 Uncharacterised protein [Legionella bozemanae]
MADYKSRMVIASICLLLDKSNAFAQSLMFFPNTENSSRLTTTGGFNYFQNSTNGNGFADYLLPLNKRNNSLLFTNLDIKIGQQESKSGSAGLGYRYLNTQSIVGAYLFTDVNNTIFNKTFTTLNPGIEWRSKSVDFHVNAYVPVTNRIKLLSSERNQITSFQSRRQITTTQLFYEAVGAGGDMSIGKQFSHLRQSRAYVGGYYYSPQQMKAIKGMQAGVDIPIMNQVVLNVADSYDNNLHNTFFLGVSIQFGGVSPLNQNRLEDHFSDAIPRHLGTLNTGSSIPSETAWIEKKSETQFNNIWFFNGASSGSSNITPDSCTFEHPCSSTQLNQNSINNINKWAPGANLYLETGTYDISPDNNQLFVLGGQSFFGRTYQFAAPAPFGAQPLLNGSLVLQGNNTIANIALAGTGTQQTAGVVAGRMTQAVSNININSVSISDFRGNTEDAGYGITAYGTDINIDNALIENIQGGTNPELINTNAAYGIRATNSASGQIDIRNTSIQNIYNNNSGVINAAYGINVENNGNGVITAENNFINHLTLSPNEALYGIYSLNNGVGGIYLQNNVMTDFSVSNAPGGMNQAIYGISALNNNLGATLILNNTASNFQTNNASVGTTIYGINAINQQGIIQIDNNKVFHFTGASSDVDVVNGLTIANYGGTARVSGNLIDNITAGFGGSIGGTAQGINLFQIYGNSIIANNQVSRVTAGNNAWGGDAQGIYAVNDSDYTGVGGVISLIDNRVSEIYAGNGSNIGGTAIGISTDNRSGNLLIDRNTVAQVRGGTGEGIGGSAMGIYSLNQGSEVSISNSQVTNIQGGNSDPIFGVGGDAYGIYGYYYFGSDIIESDNFVSNVTSGQGGAAGIEGTIVITSPPG